MMRSAPCQWSLWKLKVGCSRSRIAARRRYDGVMAVGIPPNEPETLFKWRILGLPHVL